MHPITLALAVGSVSLNAMVQIALRKTMLTTGPLPSGVANALGFAFSLLLKPWFLAGMTCYALSKGIRIFLSRRERQPDPDCRDRTDLLRHSRSFPEYFEFLCGTSLRRQRLQWSRLDVSTPRARHGVVNFDLKSPTGPVLASSTRFICGDVRKHDDLVRLELGRDDVVYHLAARQFAAAVPRRRRDARFFETNVQGTQNVVDAMRAGGASHLVYFSTDIMTYGTPKTCVPCRLIILRTRLASMGAANTRRKRSCSQPKAFGRRFFVRG
jgi:NAD dependent epimerase/dehydratase family